MSREELSIHCGDCFAGALQIVNEGGRIKSYEGREIEESAVVAAIKFGTKHNEIRFTPILPADDEGPLVLVVAKRDGRVDVKMDSRLLMEGGIYAFTMDNLSKTSLILGAGAIDAFYRGFSLHERANK